MTLAALRTEIENLAGSNKLKIGHHRFMTRLHRLLPHLEAAALAMQANAGNEKTSNEAPAEALFKSKHETGSARNALFHLEALGRIYRKTHSKDTDTFEALKNAFKELEDGLGRVDYYDAFLHEARAMNAEPGHQFADGPAVCGYFAGGYHAELQNLTKRLRDSGWLLLEEDGSVSAPRLAQVLETLDGVKWKKDAKDRVAILEFFVDTLEKIIDKAGYGDPAKALDFSQLEDGVHEFRRTVRWMSIYPQCLGGLCELSNDAPDALDSSLIAYFTPASTSGKFNTYVPDDRESDRIDIDASLIFAFSYVIGAIGDIKDGGQQAEALELALGRTTGAEGSRLHDALHQWLAHPPTPESICTKVSDMVRDFLEKDKVPQRLKSHFEAQI